MKRLILSTMAAALGCGETVTGPSFGDGTDGSGPADSTGEAPGVSDSTGSNGTTAVGDADSGSDDAASTGFIFDVGDSAGSGGPSLCEVSDGMDAVVPCEDMAPPDAFEPEVQWAWYGEDNETNSVVTPLVANLTDDNGDGNIDLCDVPDVVVVAYGCDDPGLCIATDGHIYVLDGATGELHFRIETEVNAGRTPALGDIDDDGMVEIISAVNDRLVAFEHDGTLKWTSPDEGVIGSSHNAALADLDLDGDVEIVEGRGIFDHDGILVALPGVTDYSGAPTAADLDGDGDLEVILGGSAIHHDGVPYFVLEGVGGFNGGFGQVANLDGDPQPEVVFATHDGLVIAEHDGTVAAPLLSPIAEGEYDRPVTIHDFDGDDTAELAVKTETQYAVMELDASVHWSAVVDENSYGSGGTAFDFLGDGTAEAIYADEHNLFVFDDTGGALLSVPRSSYTAIEYPVVADVDNDGSAEIVVVSNRNQSGVATAPTVQVVRDIDDRWIPARRIWNQHSYHVTNVREDGTIPSPEPRSWEHLNTFRTQAQITGQGGALCDPAG